MSLEDLGNLGEFLGSIGVIVSLIYLALQIRQNTRSFLKWVFSYPGTAAWWKLSRELFNPGLQEFVDHELL